MSERPRVLILGGGFAGVGAAQKLRRADAEVVLVDRHDYHTFQPLLYQFATGLLETTAVGHSLRDLLQRQDNTTVHQATVTGVDLDAREVHFDELAPMTYDFLVLGLGAEVNFFGTDGAAEHAFPMYTLPHARSPQGSPARAVGGRRPRPEPGGRRRAQHRHRRRGTDGGGDRRGDRRALPGGLRARLSGAPAGEGARDPGRGRAGAVLDVQAEASQVRGQGAGGAHGRGDDRRDGLVRLADAGHAQDRRGAEGAHPGLGRRPAGQPARPGARARAPARESHRRRGRPRPPRPPGGATCLATSP